MKKAFAAVFIVLLMSGFSFSDEIFPKKGWKDKPNPLASPYSEIGGEMSIYAGQYPKSFNYFLDNNNLTFAIFSLMYESLLGVDPVTYEFMPGLAEKWRISEDKKTFTFYINPKARWSDGKPITAEDVKWTFDTILSPKNMTGIHKVSLERFELPKVIDKRTIQFTAKTRHWQNLLSAGVLHILPKHAYKNKNFNKINFNFPVISGPYKFGEINEGIYIKMKRRNNWWQKDSLFSKNTGNFKTLKYRFYADPSNAFEAFKKGMIDLYRVSTAQIWVKETSGDDFISNRIIKQRIINYQPSPFQGFAMNIRTFPFNDVNVRKAMAYLWTGKK